MFIILNSLKWKAAWYFTHNTFYTEQQIGFPSYINITHFCHFYFHVFGHSVFQSLFPESSTNFCGSGQCSDLWWSICIKGELVLMYSSSIANHFGSTGSAVFWQSITKFSSSMVGAGFRVNIDREVFLRQHRSGSFGNLWMSWNNRAMSLTRSESTLHVSNCHSFYIFEATLNTHQLSTMAVNSYWSISIRLHETASGDPFLYVCIIHV